jgi:cytochrome P450
MAEKLIALHCEKKEFREDWLVNMTMTNFGAGVETTSITMSTALYYIVKTPGIQQRVQKEVDDAKKTGKLSDPPRLGEMQTSLPFLDACISESMRLHPVVGTTLPRVVPEGGVEIENHFLPAGV